VGLNFQINIDINNKVRSEITSASIAHYHDKTFNTVSIA